MVRSTSLVTLVSLPALFASEGMAYGNDIVRTSAALMVNGQISGGVPTAADIAAASTRVGVPTAYSAPSSASTPLLAADQSTPYSSQPTPLVDTSSSTPVSMASTPVLAPAPEPSGQAINAVANIDPAAGKHAKAKSVVHTKVGDAKVKAKVVVRNTSKGPVARTKVKVRGELPPGTTVNAIGNVGNATVSKSSTTA